MLHSLISLLLVAILPLVSAISEPAAGKPLNIHIIAHTHDDVGWLKTVDEYYYGANNTIQQAQVQYILDSVVYELQKNPERRFIYVEIAFFYRWWREQNEATREIVRGLVKSEQLSFVNGGWCMNDEAGTHYEAVIDQMTLGHAFLLEEFGVRPTIAWHIDPFGHASAQASMFARMGMDAFFFARIDYQDYARRNVTRELEVVWEPSRSLATAQTSLFTHMLYDSSYGPPDGFCFQCDSVQPVMDDKRLENYNLEARAAQFAKQMRTRSLEYRSSHLLVTFGSDFQYANANINFKNMDKLIAYLNANSERFGMHVEYSTPSRYISAVNAEQRVWPTKSDDFFPYADRPHAYWTGYFTSRPALKGYVRQTNGVYHGATKLLFTAGSAVARASGNERLLPLREALGVAQHHDAVAGTEKQHVADDYAKRLAAGRVTARQVISESIASNLLGGGAADPSSLADSFKYCPYLNVSSCPALEAASESAPVVPLMLYNSLAWQRSDLVRLPVARQAGVAVYNASMVPVPSQLLPNDDTGAYTLAFIAHVPPMGFATYFIDTGAAASRLGIQEPGPEVSKSSVTETFSAASENSIESDAVQLSFDLKTGLISALGNKRSFLLPLSQQYFWYNESMGIIDDNQDDNSQPDGAYIFRPNQSTPFPINTQRGNLPTLRFVRGPIVSEARQSWADWVSQTARVWQSAEFVEFENNIGPIPIGDGMGKEVIKRYTSPLPNQKTWYTDSQGLEMQERRFNFRPTWNLSVNEPVAGNYYPKNSAAYIASAAPGDDRRFTLVTDRSSGCGALADGALEYMLHRRLLFDDYRGVGEPLNETEGIRAFEHAFVGTQQQSSQLQRERALHLNHPLMLVFGSPISSAQDWSSYSLQHAPLATPLPRNVHLLSLDLPYTKSFGPSFRSNAGDDASTVLLRLHHIYAKDENAVYSKPVSIDLNTLFRDWLPSTLTEMTLSANRDLSNLNRLHWKTESSAATSANEQRKQTLLSLRDAKLLESMIIELKPMEIRSFLVTFNRKSK